MSLSDAMQTVLRLADENGGTVTMKRLVEERTRSRGQSKSVARASLSRTVRRMWKRGLVELWPAYEYEGTATEQHEAAKARYERVREDPEGEYEAYCEHWRGVAAMFGNTFTDDTYGGPEAFLEAHREAAERDVPRIRVRRVELTDKGRETTDTPVKSSHGTRVNRGEVLDRAVERVGL